jgi:hypothetical protein
VVRVTGRVVNGNTNGRVGIRFFFVPEEDLGLLESWLATELAKLESAEMPLGEPGKPPMPRHHAGTLTTHGKNQI